MKQESNFNKKTVQVLLTYVSHNERYGNPSSLTQTCEINHIKYMNRNYQHKSTVW